ncbi:purine-binding chemotaxis protein CheW [Anabaena sp. FACHB-1237]|uniref:chemotaxis protein CheW n=1 Tax=Anabaena sp. FACHB-1237 TaxID=2692769 RepID=UPI00168013D8|nr:chemotaxis protein CheW [Anabaena sp. FACHB-1237]MBD2136404.1 purine-binding chemotaxis protein CheW [Anabaena sp. FACHB-1237]
MVNQGDFFGGSRQNQLRPELHLESPVCELHLRFYVSSRQEFALQATGIKEIIELNPDRITPIPNTSPLLLGTLNLRGRLVWVTDLGQFLGETTPLNTDCSEISVIAIQDQDTIVGLAVEQLNGMHWLDIQCLLPVTNIPDNMSPFLRGEWILDTETAKNGQKKYLKLLDQIAILRSARWAG